MRHATKENISIPCRKKSCQAPPSVACKDNHWPNFLGHVHGTRHRQAAKLAR